MLHFCGMRTVFRISLLVLLSACQGNQNTGYPSQTASSDSATASEKTARRDQPGAVPPMQHDQCPCDVNAFTLDPDPTTNVRTGPKGEVMARMPTKIPGEDLDLTLAVVGYRRGWLQIGDIFDIEKDEEFRGGWIFAELLGTSTRGGNNVPLYSERDTTSEQASRILGFSVAVPILKCCGEWVYTEGDNQDGSKFAGWLAPHNQCGISYTTCP